MYFMLKHENGKPFRDVFEKPEIVEILAAAIEGVPKSDAILTIGNCFGSAKLFRLKT